MKWFRRAEKTKAPELTPVFARSSPEPVQAFFNHLATMARNNTLEDGGHFPLVVVGTGAAVEGFAINEFVDRGDDGRIELIEALWHRYAGKADWLIRVAEVWEAKIPEGAEAHEIRPSDQPDRQEALRVTAVARDGHRLGRRYVMCRDEAGKLVDLVAEEEADLRFQDVLEAPLFGTRLEWLAPVFDPTTR